MSYTEQQLRDLFDRAYGMPYGPGQQALLERVIAQADAMGLAELAFLARMEATMSYVHGGEPARALVTFAWCLAEFDRDPATHGNRYTSLLWQYRYAVRALRESPDVPLHRVHEVLDDMQRRYRETGHTMHAVYAFRHAMANHVGDRVAAGRYFQQWCAEPRDGLSSCDGCDPSAKAAWLISEGRDEEAVALAEEALVGRATCSKQPQHMLTTAMVPFLRTGRLARARQAHLRGYRLHRPDRSDLAEIADHVEFCARTGNEARALEILHRHLPWLDRAPSPWAEMRFAAAGALALRRAHDRDPASGDVELSDGLANRATAIAARFDARNGTSHIGSLVRGTIEADPWEQRLTL
jgi:hypothetical protein